MGNSPVSSLCQVNNKKETEEGTEEEGKRRIWSKGHWWPIVTNQVIPHYYDFKITACLSIQDLSRYFFGREQGDYFPAYSPPLPFLPPSCFLCNRGTPWYL